MPPAETAAAAPTREGEVAGYGFRTMGDAYQVYERGTLRHITDAPDEAAACAIASALTRETANLRAKLCLFSTIPTGETVARETVKRAQMIDGQAFPRCGHREDVARLNTALERAREALGYYADPETYSTIPCDAECGWTVPIMDDQGQMARVAVDALWGSSFEPSQTPPCTG